MDLFILKTWLEAKFDRKDEAGASLVEYGLLVALIAAIIVTVVGLVGLDVQRAFQTIETALP